MLSLEEKAERKRAKHRERLDERVERLREWWPLLDEPYEALVSRNEETSSVAGFDDAPGQRMCEHRLEWRRGRLCLACDNTGWRRLTDKEREDGLGVDPYASQLSSGITIVKDESPASRRAREAERNDDILAGIARDQRVRAGLEAMEDRPMRDYRRVVRKPFTVRRILRAIELLRVTDRVAYEMLPGPGGLYPLAELMYRVEHRRTQIPPAPTS